MGRKNRRKKVRVKPVKYIRAEIKRKQEAEIKRGQIWFANLGEHGGTSVQEGERPVLVISNNAANSHSPIITVLPITSKIKKAYLQTHVHIHLHQKSMVLAEQITTVGKGSLCNLVGSVSEAKMGEIENAVKVQLGIKEEKS